MVSELNCKDRIVRHARSTLYVYTAVISTYTRRILRRASILDYDKCRPRIFHHSKFPTKKNDQSENCGHEILFSLYSTKRLLLVIGPKLVKIRQNICIPANTLTNPVSATVKGELAAERLVVSSCAGNLDSYCRLTQQLGRADAPCGECRSNRKIIVLVILVIVLPAWTTSVL